MFYYKINNFINQFGTVDYKQLDISKNIAGSQVYPHDFKETNICLLANAENIEGVNDLIQITEKEYNELKGEILAAHPNNEIPSEMEQLQQENTELKLAIAELAEAHELSKLETQLALAEIAEAMTGGVYNG
ncbi:hypothetical protein MKY34_13015 [Sporosarcina sp. FSL K6-1522]|uniref:hypothetical protein n=1 Tax=Sporosarcina sp. FSL K6-1522 TaxID=2921554 RepID=UPI00315A516C